MELKRLNMGCGSIQPVGWVNIDFDPAFNTEHKETKEFEDSTFDIIVAHCTLQITPWHEMLVLLKDLNRVLKPDGVLRISLPDIIQGFEEYRKGNINWFPNMEKNIDMRLSSWLTWYSTTKTLLTQEAIAIFLYEAGFNLVSKSSYKATASEFPEIIELDTRENECYFIEAVKNFK